MYLFPRFNKGGLPSSFRNRWYNIFREKRVVNIGCIISNSTMHRPIVLKFDMLVYYRTLEVAEMWILTCGQIQDGIQPPNF